MREPASLTDYPLYPISKASVRYFGIDLYGTLHRPRFTLHLNRKVHIFSTLHQPTKQKKEVMCKRFFDLSKEFGRRTLVTGGSRGIGAAIAQRQPQEHEWTFIGAEVV